MHELEDLDSLKFTTETVRSRFESGEQVSPRVRVVLKKTHRLYTYSWPSSYDRPDIRNNLGYNKKNCFDLRPESWVTTQMPVKAKTCIRLCGCKQRPEMRSQASVWAQIRVFMDVISVSAVLYIINLANCYQNGPPKKLENYFLVSTLGKLLAFIVNYAHYTTLFYY
jgi:hypothetical protein